MKCISVAHERAAVMKILAWLLVCVGVLGALVKFNIFVYHRFGNDPRRILVDTDVDMDDVFALLYLLKQSESEFKLEVLGSLPFLCGMYDLLLFMYVFVLCCW